MIRAHLIVFLFDHLPVQLPIQPSIPVKRTFKPISHISAARTHDKTLVDKDQQ